MAKKNEESTIIEASFIARLTAGIMVYSFPPCWYIIALSLSLSDNMPKLEKVFFLANRLLRQLSFYYPYISY